MTIQALRPYADLTGIFQKIQYRTTPTEPFKDLVMSGDSVHQIVRRDDLRVIPRHEFKLTLDPSCLEPHYEDHSSALRLVVLTRDSMLRREVILGNFGFDSIPEVISIRSEDLAKTGHRDRLPLEFVVVAIPVLRGSASLPTQKASRLAQLQVTLANVSGGAGFPYKRATAEEIAERGLPPETAVYLELLGGAEELIRNNDTPVDSLFQFWINEKVWDAMQNDRSGSSSRLRMLAVTETAAMILLSVALGAVEDGSRVEEGSVVSQLLSFVAKQAGRTPADVVDEFSGSRSLHSVSPLVQAAFRYATLASKVDEDEAAE